MDLAKTLLRITVRAFYTTEHILIVDALCLHSTLTDNDLAHILGMQTKYLRKLCGRLKEDGLISVQSRGERRADAGSAPAPSQTSSGGPTNFKDRMVFRDWYYLNFHRAIDSLKYKLWKLNRHIESMGAPTAEKKDLVCPRCKSQYTELEVMDNIGAEGFLCHRCGHLLDSAEESEGPAENESMKRMNDQLAKIVALMRQIDSTTVPENDFDTALSQQRPITRTDAHPAPKVEFVEEAKPSLQSTKGLTLKPEKISVNVSEGPVEEVDEEKLRREKAAQNMLPDWISRSTINGAITAVGAKEMKEREERERHTGVGKVEDDGEDKKVGDGDDAVMDEYWKELKAAQEREAAEMEEEEEEDDEDEDEFEDVDVPMVTVTGNGTPDSKPAAAPTPSSGLVSSNATDDERDTKRVKLEDLTANSATTAAVQPAVKAEPEADSDEDEDLDFEDV
ncbi:hypothetical protein M8818_005745 [Zalaria obscura]|uniref:Uncharacterized protein n=1 Tax=Zalaria obscura TaxID=2024903 RepID=A0ACC3SD89_9PEZI